MATVYRAENIGSFLRPPALLEARDAHRAGRLSAEQLRDIEDRAILDALELQRSVGIDVFTDGEFRRGAFLSGLADAVEGFVPDKIAMEWHGPGGGEEASAAQAVGARLRQRCRLTAHEVVFLKQHAPGPFKITIPSATNFPDVSYKPGLTDRFYASRSELLAEIVGMISDEVRAVVAEGVPYVQLDAPRYAYYVDPVVRGRLAGSGVDPDQALDEAIAADNATLAGAPRAGVTLAIHLCRGNSRSRWFAAGGYEPIAEKLFGSLAVDTFLLEYDTDRAGGFEPLRFVPPDKTVVLGLVTTKEPTLESQDLLRRRIDEAARYVPLERLALSPQCGFASIAAGNFISQDDERRKLELVVDTARKVWSS
jgi:5-methyltetrahydropteroyltriglutamate--homocysteine methyltransferase